MDRHKKFCPKCAASESILEMMYLVPIRFIDPEDVASLESDYEDWDEYVAKQTKLQVR